MRYGQRVYGVFVGMGLLLPLLGACGGNTTANSSSPIVIGMVEPYSGAEASYGQWVNDAWTFATQKLGSSVQGHPLTVVRGDSKCEPATAVSAGRQVLDQHPALLIAPVCSGDTLALAPLIVKDQIPTLSDNIAPSITSQGQGWIWRVQITTSTMAAGETKYMLSQGYKRIGVIYDTTAPNVAAAQAIINSLTDGGLPPAVSTTYNINDTDYSGPLLKLKAANLDSLYVCGYEIQGARLVVQAKQLGFTQPMYGNFSLFDDTFIKAAGAAADGLTGVTTYTSNWSSAAQKFDQEWFSEFGYHTNADIAALYEMAVAAIDALNKSPEARGKALNDILAKTSIPNLPMGALSFDSHNENGNPVVLLVNWKNQQLQTAKVLTGHE
jgi:branched-chain amino acid transport system substrate-binding protein